MTYDGRLLMMKDDNEDDLKNKEDLHIGGRIEYKIKKVKSNKIKYEK